MASREDDALLISYNITLAFSFPGVEAEYHPAKNDHYITKFAQDVITYGHNEIKLINYTI